MDLVIRASGQEHVYAAQLAAAAVMGKSFCWSFDKAKPRVHHGHNGSPVRGEARRTLCVTTDTLPTSQSRPWVRMRRGVSAAGTGFDTHIALCFRGPEARHAAAVRCYGDSLQIEVAAFMSWGAKAYWRWSGSFA